MELTIEQMKDELIKDNGSSPEYSYYNYENSTKWNEVNLGINATVADYVQACKDNNVDTNFGIVTVRAECVPFEDYYEDYYYLEWESIKTKEEWEEWIKEEYAKLLKRKRTRYEQDLHQYQILKQKLGL